MGKSSLTDLAIAGGTPAFADPLHVGRPNIPNRARLMARITEVLDRRWLTNDGPCVREFEARIAQLVGVKHCIAVCNGTTALGIALHALELQGEVLLPALTFIATAHAVQWHGLTPVFCDVDPVTYTLDPTDVEARLTPKTAAILGVHLWGRPCRVEALTALARRRRVRLLFDAAHALGVSHQGRMIGTFGDAEVFSFHATKFLNTFEGGAIVTDEEAVAARARRLRNFGFSGYDTVASLGTNGKLHEISAVMGLTALDEIEAVLAVNRRHYDAYRQGLAAIPGVRLLEFDAAERNNYQYLVIELDEALTQVTRDELVEALWAEGVLARRYFYPGCHRAEPYVSQTAGGPAALPVTDAVVRRVITLPTGTAMDPAAIQTVCQLLQTMISRGAELHAWYARRRC